MIPFNSHYLTNNEKKYIHNVLNSDKQSGDGSYTLLCHEYLKKYSKNSYPLLTTSCTHSLEMSALLLDIKEGDEVIMPSYTFVSTANAFLLRGAKIIFCDSQKDNPNLDVTHLESLITNKTRVIVPVHYAGVSCNMDRLKKIAKKNNLLIVEDAAQGIGAYYKDIPLGTIGDFGCVSFHDTKNISCGEGGAIFINNLLYRESSDIIREKGTNRASFFRGEVDKYGWRAIGSSYLPSDILAAKLLAQFEELELITNMRIKVWNNYFSHFKKLEDAGKVKLPKIPKFAKHNGHIFYLICDSLKERSSLIKYLKVKNISAFFHYLSLHNSHYFKDLYTGDDLVNANYFSDCLIRLPIYPNLKNEIQKKIINSVFSFYS